MNIILTIVSSFVFLIFFVLKISGYIAWPWVFVASPIWICFFIFGCAFLVIDDIF